MFNQVVTIFNAYKGVDSKTYYKRYVAKRCMWDFEQSQNDSKQGKTISDNVIISVLYSNDYESPLSWNSNSDKFTLRAGDRVVIGDIEYNLSESTLKAFVETHKSKQATIKSAHELFFGSKGLWHIEVIAT